MLTTITINDIEIETNIGICKAFIAHHPARLIEPRLKGLVDLLLKEYALIKTIKATLSKPEAIDYARNVSQTITVTRATD